MPIGKSIRKDFPIFLRKIHGQRLAYLDNAATTHSPRVVLQAVSDHCERHHSSTHRGVHTLAEEATDAYEKAREKVARFIGAKPNEIVFTRNATESLNLLSYSLQSLLPRDRARPILLTRLEHHSNLVPWQQMALRSGRRIQMLEASSSRPIAAATLSHLPSSLRPALFPVAHASNVLGTLNDAAALADFAHLRGCPLVLDAAQSIPHRRVNAKKLGVDFIAFSGHKMLAPTGIGVLYMAEGWMERLPPFMSGGGQIATVGDLTSTFAQGPAKFEAGTPHVGGAIGLAAATDYLKKIGMDKITAHEQALAKKTIDLLLSTDGITVHGPPPSSSRIGVVSFTLEGVHAHDVGSILDRFGVATRSGHHCAQPLMRLLGVPATSRASFYLYNDTDDIEALMEGLREAKKIFA